MRAAALVCAAAALVLGGCAAVPSQPAPTRAPPAPARSGVVRLPQVMAPQGIEGVIGAPAAVLTSRLGQPRLDVPEGDARKLQFAGSTCVIDIYLYPLRPGAEPTATHVAARQRQGGAPADPGGCLREIDGR